MKRVRRGRSVAIGAGKDGVVIRIRVACSAYAVRIPVSKREEGVILRRQCRGEPGSSRVTCRAGGRPSGGHMVRIGCRGEVRLVARVAVGRRSRENVIDVALVARNVHMCASKREWRVVVIESSSGPRRCRMARFARGRESSRCMIRVRRSIPICLVAPIAGRRQRRVVVIRMALRALQRCVRARKWECGVVVVEGGRNPGRCRVAYGAIRRKPG